MAAGEDIMAFIGFVGFVVILFSAVKIIVAGKPTAEGEEKGAVISAVCPPLSKGWFWGVFWQKQTACPVIFPGKGAFAPNFAKKKKGVDKFLLLW